MLQDCWTRPVWLDWRNHTGHMRGVHMLFQTLSVSLRKNTKAAHFSCAPVYSLHKVCDTVMPKVKVHHRLVTSASVEEIEPLFWATRRSRMADRLQLLRSSTWCYGKGAGYGVSEVPKDVILSCAFVFRKHRILCSGAPWDGQDGGEHLLSPQEDFLFLNDITYLKRNVISAIMKNHHEQEGRQDSLSPDENFFLEIFNKSQYESHNTNQFFLNVNSKLSETWFTDLGYMTSFCCI